MIAKNLLKQAAKVSGIEEISAANAKNLPEFSEKFHKWLELGYNGGMQFLNCNVEKRENPELLLANAKTIIVALQPYPANIYFGDLKIAKYALPEDYHISLRKKLQNLTKIFSEKFAGKYYISVDSGAIFEKEWAVLAKLGWRGKNSLVINKKYGSYFNIGVIITDLAFELSDNFETEQEFGCGTCELCKKSCPTDAIVAPGVVDARRCISYLTIEAKLSENISFRKEIAAAKYIFGCDICQDVCPHNRRFLESELVSVDINKDELSNLSNKDFGKKFTNSAIKRLRANRLKRNLETIFAEYE